MTTTYDKEIDEFVCTCAAGEFFGASAADAEALAREALRIMAAHERKNIWTPIASGVYEVKGVGR